jgi:hypothetical protein
LHLRHHHLRLRQGKILQKKVNGDLLREIHARLLKILISARTATTTMSKTMTRGLMVHIKTGLIREKDNARTHLEIETAMGDPVGIDEKMLVHLQVVVTGAQVGTKETIILAQIRAVMDELVGINEITMLAHPRVVMDDRIGINETPMLAHPKEVTHALVGTIAIPTLVHLMVMTGDLVGTIATTALVHPKEVMEDLVGTSGKLLVPLRMVAHHGTNETPVQILLENKAIVEVTGMRETIDHLKFEREMVASVTMPEAAGGMIGHPSFVLTLTREEALDLLFRLHILELLQALQLSQNFLRPLCRHLLDEEEVAAGGEVIGEVAFSGTRVAPAVEDHSHPCCISNRIPMAQ